MHFEVVSWTMITLLLGSSVLLRLGFSATTLSILSLLLDDRHNVFWLRSVFFSSCLRTSSPRSWGVSRGGNTTGSVPPRIIWENETGNERGWSRSRTTTRYESRATRRVSGWGVLAS